MLERPNDLIEENENLKLKSDKMKSNDNLLYNLINKGSTSSRTEDLLGSEEIFISIKKNIEAKKKRNEAFHLQKETTQTLNEAFHLQKETTQTLNNNTNNINNLEKDLENKSKIKSSKDTGNIPTDENNNDIKEFNLKETSDGKIVFEYNTFNSKDNKTKEKPQFELDKNWKPLDKNFPLLYEVNDSKNKSNGFKTYR